MKLEKRATSTILSLWVVCHGHSDLGRYPLVGPVVIPRTWLILLLKIVLAGSSPGLHGIVLPYIAYTPRECATGQGMVFHLSVARVLAGSLPGLHCTPLYSLYTTRMCRWTGYGLSPLCPKGYMISWVFVNRVFPARFIWFSRWILFVLQVHKGNDYITYRALLQLPINGFKTRLRSFCPLS